MVCKNRFAPLTPHRPAPQARGSGVYEARKSYDFLASQFLRKLTLHGNEFVDRKDNDIFKHGISSDPIEKDGLFRRMKIQLRLLNVFDNWKRFFVRILITNIADRPTAKKIEKEHIARYMAEKGKRPRGNPAILDLNLFQYVTDKMLLLALKKDKFIQIGKVVDMDKRSIIVVHFLI